MLHKRIHAPNDWPQTATDIIISGLRKDLIRKGRASLVVPGGRTAKSVFPLLAQVDIHWADIDITLSDERWVDITHPDSNEHLVRETLLKSNAGTARFVSLKTDDTYPEEALEKVGNRLAEIQYPFSVTFIGMGEDGHFASVFPNADIPQNETGLMTAERPDHLRISLTPAALVNSNLVVLIAPGIEKRKILDKAEVPGKATEYPIRHILHQNRTPVVMITG